MPKHWIKNYKELAINENRKLAMEIVEAGFDAINTESVILNSVKLENNILSIQGNDFELSKFKKIKVIGFGKASCEAAFVLEKVLGDKIKEGVVVGLQKITCEYIETFAGTHPRPTEINIEPGKKIFDIANNSAEDDLIIAIVSGGGSALLAYPESEYIQGQKLYDSFLSCGKTIGEINTIRKHISLLKGGGLAKIAYPATIIGLIFSDVPGDKYEDVASGPTYKDETTIESAQSIIDSNNLGDFDLIETPKEDKYFEKVHNFVLVSNKTALLAMEKKCERIGLKVQIVSTDLYDETSEAIKKIFEAQKNFDGEVILAAGEPKIEVKKCGGKGGRNLHMGLKTIELKMIEDDSVFIAIASDGMDNSDAAGAMIDKDTIQKINKLNIDISDSLDRFDTYSVFEKSGEFLSDSKKEKIEGLLY
jgi:glycerate-2-kinase